MVEIAKEKIVLLSSLMPSKPEVNYLKQQLDLSLGKTISYADDTEISYKTPKAKLFEDDGDDDYVPPSKSKPVVSSNDFDDDEDDPDGAALFAKINSRRASV